MSEPSSIAGDSLTPARRLVPCSDFSTQNERGKTKKIKTLMFLKKVLAKLDGSSEKNMALLSKETSA